MMLTAPEFLKWLLVNHPPNDPIAKPQLPNCKLVVVVPVRAERVKRIMTLLRSLALQRIEPGTIEALLVINNIPDDGTKKWQKMYQLNQQLLHSLLFKNRGNTHPDINTEDYALICNNLAVHAIDQSSADYCVEGGNVGTARQRGLIEAAARFAKNGRNGIILHTDADCRYDDTLFASRLLSLFNHLPDLLAIGGSYTLEARADDPEALNLVSQIDNYVLIRRYESLYSAIIAGDARYGAPYLLGSCGAHRAFEGVLAGGFPPKPLIEDVLFGEALEAFAAQHGMRTDYTGRYGLGPVTAFRLSDRTDNANTKRYMSMIGVDGTIKVDDAFNPGTNILLDASYINRLAAAVLKLPGGQERLERLFVTLPMARIRVV